MTRKKLNKRHGGTRKNNRKGGHQKNKKRNNDRLLIQEYRADSGLDDKSKKSKSHKKSMKHALRNLNSMIEMNQGDFGSLDEMAINSLDMSLKRQSKADKRMSRMAQIADFTDRNHRSTMMKALRKFPVDFVKAEEIYNPSEQLFKSWGIKGSLEQKEVATRDSDGLLDPSIQTDDENLTVDDENVAASVQVPAHDSTEEVDSDSIGVDAYPSNVSLEGASSIQGDSFKEESDSEESILIVDDNEDSEYEGSSNVETEYENKQYKAGKRNRLGKSNKAGKKNKFNKGKAANHGARNKAEREDITIGKFLAPVEEDENGDSYITLPKLGKRHGSRTTLQEIGSKRSKLDSGEVEDEQDSTEFGFLPEDYNLDIDISQITFDNIRYGDYGDAQYHVKAKVITGMKNHQWLSKGELLDSMMDIGLKRNRFDAFIRYALENLYTGEESLIVPERESLEEAEGDVSDESENGNESDEIESNNEIISDDMLEGLDDMISFRNKQVRVVEDPVDIATHSLDQHGHGKNRKLDLPKDMDPDLRQMLVDSFESRVEGSSHKRREREEKVHREVLLSSEARENVSSSDSYYMLKKYPYEMQIGDFRSELEAFLVDDNRNSLRFPPMDNHGCMTLRDMSRAFHFKPRKFGKAPECYIVSVKTSASKRQSPDYREIDKLMNRRKLFFRSDAGLTKREKKEIGQLLREIKPGDGKKSKNKAAFMYKEGDVVGANASRIGPESIGRQLLVKMGWQNGEALGKEGNKGIIEPITAVVKTTKVGIR